MSGSKGDTTARERLPPRPSFLRERTVRLARPGGVDQPVHLGMDRPATSPDGWWTTVAWARDEDGVISCLDVAPRSGPPPEPPLMRMGPAFAGALAGLVAEVDGRQAVRLRLPAPADPGRPWDRPLVVQIALAWEPMRAATLTPNQLAVEVLVALGRAIEAAGRAA